MTKKTFRNYGKNYEANNLKLTPENLREWRERHDMGQQELADLLGVYFMTISRWERGIQKIPPFLHLALSQLDSELVGKPTLKLVDNK